jgi:hypothetical protein
LLRLFFATLSAAKSLNAARLLSNAMDVFTKLQKWLSFDRIGMMYEHYVAVHDQIKPRNALDKHEFEVFSRAFRRYHTKARRLGKWRFVFYMFLYAAVIVRVLAYIPVLEFLAPIFELGNALVGGGLAFVMIFLFTVRINLHLQRMEACMYHLTALYHQNPKRDSDKALRGIKRVI